LIDNDGYITGDSTDGPGFMLDLRNHQISDVSKISVAIIGAGGCAHALAFELLESGCLDLSIYNRSAHNAEALMNKANNIFPKCVKMISMNNLKDADLVINTAHPSAVNSFVFRESQVIYDTNYMSDALNIKKSAESAGSRFISGIGMLLYSGALSFEFFTGHKAPIDVMRKALY
jgi:shikimate dehydrogenase